MTVIFVSTKTRGPQAKSEVIQLEIIADSTDFAGRFDVLEVWRSEHSRGGPFEEVTAERWKVARIPKLAGDPPALAVQGGFANISGKTLAFRLTERDDLLIRFSGADPLTFSNAAEQIRAQSSGLLQSYVDADGRLVVETESVGTSATLRVLPSDAAIFLGLPITPPEYPARGRSARIPLAETQQAYRFFDLFGSRTNWYKARFRNVATGATSAYSEAFNADAAAGVPPERLIAGVIDLIDQSGRPMAEREVRVSSTFDGELVDGRVVAGQDLIGRTDERGHVEFLLVRGQRVTVAIIGTNIVRNVTPPLDPSISIFQLLDPKFGEEQDYFTVRVPDIPFAARRSM